MPNKYEREIEKILRNLERTERKARFGQRINNLPRRAPGASRSVSLPRLGFTEWCLIIALVAALAAGGWADANDATLITGAIAVIGAVCILLVALSNFLPKPKPRYQAPTTRYNNVTRLPGNPLRRLTTSWHLMILKLRYRKRDREKE